jgi:hypothetical protein
LFIIYETNGCYHILIGHYRKVFKSCDSENELRSDFTQLLGKKGVNFQIYDLMKKKNFRLIKKQIIIKEYFDILLDEILGP